MNLASKNVNEVFYGLFNSLVRFGSFLSNFVYVVCKCIGTCQTFLVWRQPFSTHARPYR